MTDVDNPSPSDNHNLDSNDLIAAATKLWNRPTKRGKVEWRFGTHGSKSIRLDKLVWRDHETGEGGGIVELCERAGINGHYRDPAMPHPANSGDSWEPRIPAGPAPQNMLFGRVFEYRDIAGNITHYVRRIETPRSFPALTYGKFNGVLGWHPKAPKPPLALYGIENIRELDPELIFLVEGEKACDAANARFSAEELPWLALSWFGGAKRAKDADISPVAGRKIIVWPDADEPGLKALDTLCKMLPDAGWIDTEGLPDKFDAADLPAGESIKAFIEARLRKPRSGDSTPANETTTELKPGKDWPAGAITREDFFAIMPLNVYVYIPTLEFWSAVVIDKRIGKKTSTWICKNKPVEQVTWSPGHPRIITGLVASEGYFIPHEGNRIFNTYRPPSRNGGDASQAQKWLDHVMLVYPDDWRHIVHWLAHRVQHPEVKINHALVLGGAMGNGKDTLIEPVRQAIGPGNFRETYPQKMLRSDFNGYVRSVILRINEARDLGEFDRFKFYDHIKTLFVTPPFTIPCNEKYIKEIEIANVVSVIITTNHKADGIYLPPDDRRHYVAWTQMTQNDFTAAYWNDLWGWYETGGYGHVAAYLRTLDLSSFNPKAAPPKTRAFWEITDASRAPEDAEISDVVDLLGNPAALILDDLKTKAQGEILEWLKDRKNRRVIPHRLEKAGYVPVRNPDRQDGLWIFEWPTDYGGKSSERRTVYAKMELPIRDQITAARHLITSSGQ